MSSGIAAEPAIRSPNTTVAKPSNRSVGRPTDAMTRPPITDPIPLIACTAPSAPAPAWYSNFTIDGTRTMKLYAKIPTKAITPSATRRSCRSRT